MKCKNCGVIVDEGYRFCPQCGTIAEDTLSHSTKQNTSVVTANASFLYPQKTVSEEVPETVVEEVPETVEEEVVIKKEESQQDVPEVNEENNRNEKSDAAEKSDESKKNQIAPISVGSEKVSAILNRRELAQLEFEKEVDQRIQKNTRFSAFPNFVMQFYKMRIIQFTMALVICLTIAIFCISYAGNDLIIVAGVIFLLLSAILLLPASRTWIFFIAPTKSVLYRKLATFGDARALLIECEKSFGTDRVRVHGRVETSQKSIVAFHLAHIFIAPIKEARRGYVEEIARRVKGRYVGFSYRLHITFSNGLRETVKTREYSDGNGTLKSIERINKNFKSGGVVTEDGIYF